LAKYRLENSGIMVTLSAKHFASGGEGNLYTIISPGSMRKYVAKIYHPHKLSDKRQKKINYLAQFPPIYTDDNSDDHPSVVWVKDALYDRDKFVGFIMPYVIGEKLEILCTPKIPRKLRSTWRRFDFKSSRKALDMRMKLCFNICAAIHQVHSVERYVLVDMKPDNIVIKPNGLVSIVDTDSVEVVENGKSLFDAPVATPEYTPPEFYRKLDYDPTEKEEWDRFGLGVIIYKLLFGIHPFAASSGGSYEHLVSLDDKIKHGLFVHHPAQKASFKIIPPPHRGFYKVDKGLQALFMRCFVDGHENPEYRPSAEEWCATILLAMDDEAAYKRYGHILGGGLMSGRPRYSLPSSCVPLPLYPEAASKIVAMSKESDIPKPKVHRPTNRQLKKFKVESLTQGQFLGMVFALAIAFWIAPPLSMIAAALLFNRMRNEFLKEKVYIAKGVTKDKLGKSQKEYNRKSYRVGATQRKFKKSVRRIIPKIEKITQKIKYEIDQLKEYLETQDDRVKEIEDQAFLQYQDLNKKYVDQAESNRIIARVEDGNYDSLSKIRIAINKSHKEAVDLLTKKQPISSQHPEMKEGKIAIDALVKAKRIKITDLVGKQTTALQKAQIKDLAALYQVIEDDASLLRNMHRLWAGRKPLSEKELLEAKQTLKGLNFVSITQINSIDGRSGWVKLKNGTKFSVKEFPEHKTVLKNLRHWHDETKHQLTAYGKEKSEIRKSYRLKIKKLDDQKRIELKGIESFKKDEMKAIKVKVQLAVLGKPFSNLMQEHEAITEYVDELETEYVQEEKVILQDYNELYESIIIDCQTKVAQAEKKIKKLERDLGKYSNKISHPKVQKRYKELEKELNELKGLIPRLEQREFEYSQYENIDFTNYLKAKIEKTF